MRMRSLITPSVLERQINQIRIASPKIVTSSQNIQGQWATWRPRLRQGWVGHPGAGCDLCSLVSSSSRVNCMIRVQVEEIAKIKLPDLNTVKLQSAMNTVMGTAKNMGIEVEDA